MTGECHLDQGHGDAAVGAIVIREHARRGAQLRERGGERDQSSWLFEIGGFVTELRIDLRQHRAAETLTTGREIDQQQGRRTDVGTQLRRQRPPHVTDRRERRRRSKKPARPPSAHRSRPAKRYASTKNLCRPGSRCRARDKVPRPTARTAAYKAASSPGIATSGHPIRRQTARRDSCAHVGRQNIGDRFGKRPVAPPLQADQQGDGRALAHGHRLARDGRNSPPCVTPQSADRHLPRSDHLSRGEIMPPTVRSPMVMRNVLSATVGESAARSHTLHRGYRWPASRRFPKSRLGAQCRRHDELMRGRLAEQDFDRHLDRRLHRCSGSRNNQLAVVGDACRSTACRATFAATERHELIDVIGSAMHEYVALLATRYTTTPTARCPGSSVGIERKIDAIAPRSTVRDGFWNGIRQHHRHPRREST
jgi:hypothetical protein